MLNFKNNSHNHLSLDGKNQNNYFNESEKRAST